LGVGESAGRGTRRVGAVVTGVLAVDLQTDSRLLEEEGRQEVRQQQVPESQVSAIYKAHLK